MTHGCQTVVPCERVLADRRRSSSTKRAIQDDKVIRQFNIGALSQASHHGPALGLVVLRCSRSAQEAIPDMRIFRSSCLFTFECFLYTFLFNMYCIFSPTHFSFLFAIYFGFSSIFIGDISRVQTQAGCFLGGCLGPFRLEFYSKNYRFCFCNSFF